MAISLVTDIPGLVFSSELSQLRFATDDDTVETVRIELKLGSTSLLSTTLYFFNGYATLCEVDELVNLYMLANDLSSLTLTLIADGDILRFVDIAYCSHRIPDVDAETYLDTHFSTAAEAKRTSPRRKELLPLFLYKKRSKVEVQCSYIDNSNIISSEKVDLYPDGFGDTERMSAVSIDVGSNFVMETLASAGCDVAKLLSYTVICDNRYFTYYVEEIEADVTFTFRNCFNLEETIALHGVTTRKTEIERETACVGGTLRPYDRTVVKTYEVETAPLSPDETLWVEQLFTSPKVTIDDRDVIIIDSSCEISDSDAELNRVKFTWRYSDRRPCLPTVSDTADRIHTSEFDYQFS